ncbi:hypothetical protein [Nonomuraea polychroma]|uniref:hypothetical protein n=1 Tax=Nonomuraea polychroma TaxID=46176 RepID=UPI000FDDF05B|nr:hypothetical protein [Nonomuraea polychroma]
MRAGLKQESTTSKRCPASSSPSRWDGQAVTWVELPHHRTALVHGWRAIIERADRVQLSNCASTRGNVDRLDDVKSLGEPLAVAQGLRTDIANEAVGNSEVSERLAVVSDGTASVLNSEGLETYEGGGVIAFVNDSGIPFVAQADQLIDEAASLKPQAVLLAGSALIGRPGKGFEGRYTTGSSRTPFPLVDQAGTVWQSGTP